MSQELKDLNLPIILLVVEKLSQATENTVKSKLRKTARRVFQYYSEQLPRMVSVKAAEAFHSKGIDPQTIDAFSSSKGINKLVTLEHTTPIMQFIHKLIEMNPEDREKEVLNYSGCCWVTKEEDNRLNKNYKYTRPDGWKECYRKTGIDLVG